jgi:quinol monooxygenase YgiN
MAIALVHFKVADQARWRQAFEEHASLRQAGGCTGAHIFYNAQDPSDVFVNLHWDTDENFQKAMTSPEIQQAMAESGMVGAPEVWMLEDGGRTAS